MNRHELDIYLELYKRRDFGRIPVGIYPSGAYFYPTEKQIETLSLLSDNETTFVGYGGAARCFIGETLVQTSEGHKAIKYLQVGDSVLSYNETTGAREFKTVLKVFKFSGLHKMALFKNGLTCTYDHEFLFGGEWVKAYDLPNKEAQENAITGESREVTAAEAEGLEIKSLYTDVYDLHVEDNHNYTVTLDNIIVHNSGKTLIESTAIIFDCLAYPGIRWGFARKELVTLKKTALVTFFVQADFYGLKKDEDYRYDKQLNIITFNNGSEIILIDTAYKPSDPLNTRFGGLELTRCAIDESNETDIAVIVKLFERTGWRLNDKYKLKRKVFECFNPDKNHVHERYWRPFRDKAEPKHKKFIRALPSDNPNPAVKEWIADLIKTGDNITIERQIYGNFDYDDDPSKLCEYDAICDLFTNSHVKTRQKFISADLAMQGRDRFIAGYWSGMVCAIALDETKSTGKGIEESLKRLKNSYAVPNSHIVADSDGLGAYLESYVRNIKTFHGGTVPRNKKEFGTLKDECAFKLAELINKREIRIVCSSEQEERIKKELSTCFKRDNVNADKKRLIKKDTMKKLLGGASPDYLDMLIMRMFFEVKATTSFAVKKR